MLRGCVKVVAIILMLLIIAAVAFQSENDAGSVSVIRVNTIQHDDKSTDSLLITRTAVSIPATVALIAPTVTAVPPTATSIPPTAKRAQPTKPSFVVSRFASPRTRYTHGVVNLRGGPGTEYAIVGGTTAGAALQMLGESGDWYLIHHGDEDAYIASWLTYSSPPSAPQREQPASNQQPAQAQPAQQQPVQQQPVQQQPVQQQPVQQQPAQPLFSCSPRKNCGQMASCAEARHHLNVCGNARLDRNNDGVPCESICS